MAAQDPRAPKTAKYFISKMPNILRLVPEPYTKEAIRAEMENPSDETLYRNYVRWRYKRDNATGRVLLDDKTKLPLRESTPSWCSGRTARSPCSWARRR